MSEQILDGTGTGNKAKVGSDFRLHVQSKSESLQHLISQEDEQAYQCIGTATLASGIVVVLHLKNTSSDRNLTITYIRHQILDPSGGTSFPNASNYYKIALGRTYVSGGSTATPVNVFAGSGNTAEVTAYQGGPTLTGTAAEIDRWYTQNEGSMNVFSKEGAVIIPPNQTIEMAYIGDRTGGTVYARISFLMEQVEG